MLVVITDSRVMSGRVPVPSPARSVFGLSKGEVAG